MTATSHLLRINVVGIQGARGINFGGPKKIHVCKRVANSNSLTPLLQRNLARDALSFVDAVRHGGVRSGPSGPTQRAQRRVDRTSDLDQQMTTQVAHQFGQHHSLGKPPTSIYTFELVVVATRDDGLQGKVFECLKDREIGPRCCGIGFFLSLIHI